MLLHQNGQMISCCSNQTKPDIRMSSIRVKWILFLRYFFFLLSPRIIFKPSDGKISSVHPRARKRCIASTLNKHHSRIITHVIRTTKMMYYMQQSKEIALHGINGIHRARCCSVQPNSREQSNCTYFVWLWCCFPVLLLLLLMLHIFFLSIPLPSIDAVRLVYTWTLSHNFCV